MSNDENINILKEKFQGMVLTAWATQILNNFCVPQDCGRNYYREFINHPEYQGSHGWQALSEIIKSALVEILPSPKPALWWEHETFDMTEVPSSLEDLTCSPNNQGYCMKMNWLNEKFKPWFQQYYNYYVAAVCGCSLPTFNEVCSNINCHYSESALKFQVTSNPCPTASSCMALSKYWAEDAEWVLVILGFANLVMRSDLYLNAVQEVESTFDGSKDCPDSDCLHELSAYIEDLKDILSWEGPAAPACPPDPPCGSCPNCGLTSSDD